jgi:hypothetical protein
MITGRKHNLPRFERPERVKLNGAAAARLSSLGFRRPADVRAAVQDGAAAARAASTPMHPRSYPGQRMWGETTASLAFMTQDLGFEKEEASNVDFLANHRTGTVVIVTAGDGSTGDPGFTPQVRYPRREITSLVINGGLDRIWDANRPSWDVWLLLHHLDRGEQIVPAELSKAHEVTADGLVTEWDERIIIPDAIPPAGGRPHIDAPLPVLSDPDVFVARRAI